MVRLFDVQNGKVIPTEHCYTLGVLKNIMKLWPEPVEHMAAYAYIFYMTCPDPELNPFFDMAEGLKEDLILSQVSGEFSTEDEDIIAAVKFCEKLYQTPTFRAYMAMKSVLDKLADYMTSTTIEHGRDGNIAQIVNAAAKFEQIRASYKGAYKDLQEEQKVQVRGKQQVAYDQM